jgi:tripartite-type tricarboxylate transporter receptor subunit TctC
LRRRRAREMMRAGQIDTAGRKRPMNWTIIDRANDLFRIRIRPPLRRLLAIALLTVLPDAACAQSDYPNRSIRIVVPYAAGGSADFLARLIAAGLQARLGQSVLVENRPGASGNVGTVAVARSLPDGYTLLINTSSFIVNPSLFKPSPFDPIADFVPIVDIAAAPTAIAASNNAGIDSIADLINQARADPQKLNYGTGGPGSMPHLTVELLKLRAKVNITHIPFAGGGPAMQAAVAGTTQLTAGALANVHAQLKGGTLKGLVITSAERWHDLPTIPTMIESGYPDFVMETTHVLVAPAGTPPPIIERLAQETIAILRRPDNSTRIRQAGFAPIAGGPDQLKARFAREVPAFRELIVNVGIPPI